MAAPNDGEPQAESVAVAGDSHRLPPGSAEGSHARMRGHVRRRRRHAPSDQQAKVKGEQRVALAIYLELARRQASLRPGGFHNVLHSLNHGTGFEEVNLVSSLGDDGVAGIA